MRLPTSLDTGPCNCVILFQCEEHTGISLQENGYRRHSLNLMILYVPALRNNMDHFAITRPASVCALQYIRDGLPGLSLLYHFFRTGTLHPGGHTHRVSPSSDLSFCPCSGCLTCDCQFFQQLADRILANRPRISFLSTRQPV